MKKHHSRSKEYHVKGKEAQGTEFSIVELFIFFKKCLLRAHYIRTLCRWMSQLSLSSMYPHTGGYLDNHGSPRFSLLFLPIVLRVTVACTGIPRFEAGRSYLSWNGWSQLRDCSCPSQSRMPATLLLKESQDSQGIKPRVRTFRVSQQQCSMEHVQMDSMYPG